MQRESGRDTSIGCRNGDGPARTFNLGSAPGPSTVGGIKERQPPGRVPASGSGSQSQEKEDSEITVVNKVKLCIISC